MYDGANLALLGLVMTLDTKYIHAERGGQGGQGTAGSRVGRSDEADDEQDADNHREVRARSQISKHIVTLQTGEVNLLLCRVGIEQVAQYEEQTDDEDLQHGTGNHVLLALTEILATQSALHHILVKAGGGNDEEDTCEKLLPKERRLLGVVEEERASHVAVRQALQAHAVAHDKEDTQGDRQDEAAGLQEVSPHNGLDAATERDKIDHGGGEHSIEPERDTQGLEHQNLQHGAHDEQTDTGTKHLAHEEDPGTGLIRSRGETVVEVLVDTGEVELVEQRDKHVGNQNLSDGEAQHHLHIGERSALHHTGYADEGHAGDSCADGGHSHQCPVVLAVAGVETCAIRLTACDVRHRKQNGEIGEDGNEYC